jgi:two-component system, OmpR family, sensor kinase
MTQDDAHRVFERFYRTDSSRARSSGGTGLGLSIVDSLVSAHGGTVTVSTAPGRGSCFCVTLPRYADAHTEATETETDVDQEPSPVRAASARP